MGEMTRVKLSKNGKYRYYYRNIWDKDLPVVMFICLRPQNKEGKREYVIDSLIQYCQQIDYGGFYLCNLFAYITEKDHELTVVKDPVGKDNDMWIKKIAKRADMVIFAWGVNGKIQKRSKEVENMFSTSWALDIAPEGYPRYPLFIPYNPKLKSYKHKPKPYKS